MISNHQTNAFLLEAKYGRFGTGRVGDIDHLMICFPKATFNGFVSAAYVGGAISWYADQLCERVSLTAHELGHNFGLLHSSTYSEECKFLKEDCAKSLTTMDAYTSSHSSFMCTLNHSDGDNSGYMGVGTFTQHFPEKCFNAENRK